MACALWFSAFSSFRPFRGLLKKEKWGREGYADLIYDNLYIISVVSLLIISR